MNFQSATEIKVELSIGHTVLSVGRLASRQNKIYFQFDDEFLDRGYEISPFRCPLSPGLKTFDSNLFDGLPGVFYDSLPDGWGRLLLDRKMRSLGVLPQQLSALDRLRHVGASGMGALVYTPSETEDAVQDNLNLDSLASDVEQILEGEAGEVIEKLISLNGSSAGARPKAMIGVDSHKQRIVHGAQNLGLDYEPWLVKFPNSTDGHDAGAIEYVYARMAIDAGVQMENVYLLPSQTGPGFFATERFDRNTGKRTHCHSVCGLLHSDFRIPSLDYQDLIELTMVLTRDIREAEKMFRLAVFNVLAHNRDDHSKNFSFMMDSTGHWKLSPAYDLTFASGPNGEQSTMVLGKGRNIEISDLIKLGIESKLSHSLVDSVIERTRSALGRWRDLALNYGVQPSNVNLIQTRIDQAQL